MINLTDHGLIRPAYAGLKNNVSTIEMEMQSQLWNPGTEEFVLHNVLAEYIQDAARTNAVENDIRFNTRVQKAYKNDAKWRLETSEFVETVSETKTVGSVQVSDI